MKHMQRRIFLKGTLATGVAAAAAGIGLLKPTTASAAVWPREAFTSKTVQEVLTNLFGSTDATASNVIKIKAPTIAENGAIVPIVITAKLPNVQRISVIVEKNAQPLAASLDLGPQSAGYFQARVKMGETSDVHVAVKADGKVYIAKQNIKVTVGGCGG
jgi:sulfur-oxidizing protein SoxY